MLAESEPEWVTAKRAEDRRFERMARGAWLRTIFYGLGIYLSDFAIRSGLVAILLLDLILLMALAFAWQKCRLTFGTLGVAISVGVFQWAVWARRDDEPFANGILLALSLILFLVSLFVGNRRPQQSNST